MKHFSYARVTPARPRTRKPMPKLFTRLIALVMVPAAIFQMASLADVRRAMLAEPTAANTEYRISNRNNLFDIRNSIFESSSEVFADQALMLPVASYRLGSA